MPSVWAAAIALPLLVLYALVRPLTPDLPAQVARAEAASRGAVLWWGGWHIGLDTPTYSLVSPTLSSWLGVRTVGVLATAVLCLLAADLVRDAVRPRARAVALGLVCCANLWSSRITFAVDMAVAVRRRAGADHRPDRHRGKARGVPRRDRRGAAVVEPAADGAVGRRPRPARLRVARTTRKRAGRRARAGPVDRGG